MGTNIRVIHNTAEVKVHPMNAKYIMPFMNEVGIEATDNGMVEAVNAEYILAEHMDRRGRLYGINVNVAKEEDEGHKRSFAEALAQYILTKNNLMIVTATSGYNWHELDYFRSNMSDKILGVDLTDKFSQRDLFGDVWSFIVPRKPISSYDHWDLDRMCELVNDSTMSIELADRGLDLINDRNRLEDYLYHCRQKQYEYEDRADASLWEEREAFAREGIAAIERDLERLK